MYLCRYIIALSASASQQQRHDELHTTDWIRWPSAVHATSQSSHLLRMTTIGQPNNAASEIIYDWVWTTSGFMISGHSFCGDRLRTIVTTTHMSVKGVTYDDDLFFFFRASPEPQLFASSLVTVVLSRQRTAVRYDNIDKRSIVLPSADSCLNSLLSTAINRILVKC